MNPSESQLRAWIDISNKKPMSDFGKKVVAILDQAYFGVDDIWKSMTHKRVQWHEEHYIRIVLPGITDHNILTRIVIGCREMAIKVAVDGVAQGYIALSFTDQVPWEKRMDSVEEQAKRVRSTLESRSQDVNEKGCVL